MAQSDEMLDGHVPIVTITSPRSAAAEAFRTLRTNIQFSSLDREIRVLLITSAGPQEGKSTVLANLAVSTAETGRQVLMVDCDLRRPSLHRLFGVASTPGFTNLLVEEDLASVAAQATSVPGLALLPCGPLPPNPSELLGSRRVDRVLQQLRERADLVLLDSPPVTAVSDAAVLATKVDGVILVVSAGKTRREAARRAKAQLEKVNARVLGVVLNNTRPDPSLYSYYGPL